MEHVEVCASCNTPAREFIAIFCRPIHLSWPVDIAVQFHVLQLSFSFLQWLCRSSVYGLCWPVCKRTLWTLYWDVHARMSCVMIFLKKCSKSLHVFKPGVIALPFIDCELCAILLHVFCIWRTASCLMGSHVGPRAGCGCCMPCEVVACIVVLPLPVGGLLPVSCLLLVCIYIHDLPQICGVFVWIFEFHGFVGALCLFLSTWSFM